MLLAAPVSVTVLGYGDEFIYNEGILCYTASEKLRVLNIHGLSRSSQQDFESTEQGGDLPLERVFDLPQLLAPNMNESRIENLDREDFSLVHYSHGWLTCLWSPRNRPKSRAWLICLNLYSESSGPAEIRLNLGWRSTKKIVVRNTTTHLFCGIWDDRRINSPSDWCFYRYSLDPIEQLPAEIRLGRFVGSEPGVTSCFEIHDGYLYAVSSQSSMPNQEVEYTSYYHCVRVPVDGHERDLEILKVWRRNHEEGPINDGWTSLSLHKDEESGQLLIGESRREWTGGVSSSQRTYYMHEIPTNPLISDSELPFEDPCRFCPSPCYSGWMSMESWDASPPPEGRLPANDRLALLLGPDEKPNFSPLKERPSRNVHSDKEAEDNSPSFILAKTKLRHYDISSHSFIDLVDDPAPTSSFRVQQRLRLRVSSSQLGAPLRDSKTGLLAKSINGVVDSAQLVSRGVNLWPPDASDEEWQPPESCKLPGYHSSANSSISMSDASKEPQTNPESMYDLLNPVPNPSGKVDGVADERSIVYASGLGSELARPIILINFDEAIRIGRDLEAATGLLKGKARSDPQPVRNQKTWEWQETASWLRIEKSMWLR
ncbi:MAG: hypothetical protein M4579_001168 [Chaenotheca gracillima]|nr:MAG: hypothetical protein M4579_001168 [Chaenotheca gracillima]